MRFYEEDPAVVRVAKTTFTFLRDSAATVTTAGWHFKQKPRPSLPPAFDVIVVDAFSGDSPPTHLITLEALQLYKKLLRSDGAVAINTTNKFLDLVPVGVAGASAIGLQSRVLVAPPSSLSRSGSSWLLLTNNQQILEDPQYHRPETPTDTSVWTDDYSNILSATR